MATSNPLNWSVVMHPSFESSHADTIRCAKLTHGMGGQGKQRDAGKAHSRWRSDILLQRTEKREKPSAVLIVRAAPPLWTAAHDDLRCWHADTLHTAHNGKNTEMKRDCTRTVAGRCCHSGVTLFRGRPNRRRGGDRVATCDDGDGGSLNFEGFVNEADIRKTGSKKKNVKRA